MHPFYATLPITQEIMELHKNQKGNPAEMPLKQFSHLAKDHWQQILDHAVPANQDVHFRITSASPGNKPDGAC